MSMREKFESTEQARELRKLICATCYESQLAWVCGESREPFTPCDSCAPLLLAWLEQRTKARQS